ncbi:MAG: bifunctional homocysteine S-methyltransferase/methylenetetrahydrofolate reductase [Actinobacteria bacterium]|nr:bifunctional homocysteine S-methyltransferase/methylenetetrahydrofolate reductase [Actinomycetota bacterium]
MATRFLERLAAGPTIVADGGMGVLVSSAVSRLRCPEEANVRSPESVLSLHLGFIRAGAELIETNTFGANRRKLRERYLDEETVKINEAAVKIAREARDVSGRDVFIAGAIGPLGDAQEDGDDERAIFAEQAELLEGRGVDLFTVETFFDLEEVAIAIDAVRAVSSLPIVALLTFDEDAQTLHGVSARDAAKSLSSLDVAAVGANHSAGPQASLRAIEQMGGNGKPLAVMPNVGLASLAGQRIVFPHATPEYFGEFAAHAQELGARIIGGCCGCTPAEIAAIKSAVDEERRPAAPLVVRERVLLAPPPPSGGDTLLQRKLHAGEFVVSVEIDPPRGANPEGMLEIATTLRDSGRVDVVDVNDNPRARARMSGMMASVAIERNVGIETIPHLTPRDSSIAGLESQLLGAHAEGIRNVLAVTGDPPEAGDYPGASGVYEVDSIGLSRVITQMNAGEDFNGAEIDAPTSFFLGVAVNPAADDLEYEVERFERKLEAGAEFAMTQVLFDFAFLDRFVERLGRPCPIPLLIGIFYVRSYQLALRLHNEVPGIVVPEHVQARLRDAGPNAGDVGLELAQELLEASRERAAGVYVIPPFRQPLAALDVLA